MFTHWNCDLLKQASNCFNGWFLCSTRCRELVDSTWLLKLHLLWWPICVALINFVTGEREKVTALYTVVACWLWLWKGHWAHFAAQSLLAGWLSAAFVALESLFVWGRRLKVWRWQKKKITWNTPETLLSVSWIKFLSFLEKKRNILWPSALFVKNKAYAQ